MGEGLEGLRVATFESRRSEDMARLIAKRGGTPIQAPSMQEVPLEDQHEAFEFGETLLNNNWEIMILLTGVGTEMLVQALSQRWPRDEILAALKRAKLVCRGPKPVAALKKMDIEPDLIAPEPNTWREVLATLDQSLPVSGHTVAIQEYGIRNQELLEALETRGARVTSIPVYGWKLPDDTSPLENTLKELVAHTIDAVVFTSGHQIHNVMTVAKQMGIVDQVEAALRDRAVVASVGPVTTEQLTALGIKPDIEPERPKMGPLISALAEQAGNILKNQKPQASAPS